MKRFIYISLLSLSLTGIVTSCDLDAPAQSAMEVAEAKTERL